MKQVLTFAILWVSVTLLAALSLWLTWNDCGLGAALGRPALAFAAAFWICVPSAGIAALGKMVAE